MDKKASPTIHIYPPSPYTERGKPTLFDIHAPSGKALYCSSNVIIIRNLVKPFNVISAFTEHQVRTTAARFSLSGNKVCSGDEKGVVLVWNAEGSNMNIEKKWDFSLLHGPIRDISWIENDKIAVVGDGQKFFGKIYTLSTGTESGEISGQSKNLLSCSFRPCRPYKLVTAGEENSVQFFEGLPFKFKLSHRPHTSFINCVKYSPDGEKFITVSSDKKAFLFNGLTGELQGELFVNGHNGGIIQYDWFEDSNTLATASSDKLIRIWDLSQQKLLKTLRVKENPQIEDQQVSVRVGKNNVYSVSLSGDINMWQNANELQDGSLPTQVLYGHSNSVNQVAILPHTKELISSDTNGRILIWGSDGFGKLPSGKKDESGIIRFRINSTGTKIFTFSQSQQLIILNLNTLKYGEPLQLQGSTQDIQASRINEDVVFLLQQNIIRGIKNNEEILNIPFKHQSTVFDVSYDDSLFAIGNEGGNVLLISNSGEIQGDLNHYGSKISSISFSHNGKLLACGDSSYRIRVWNLETKQSLSERLVFSSSMITSLQFSQNDKHLISSSQDNKAVIYNMETFAKEESFDLVHKRGMNWVVFGSENKSIFTCGSDNLIKEHKCNVNISE